MNQPAKKLIDIETLTYGSTISPSTIVAFTGIPQNHRDYSLRAMELADMIDGALRLRDGKEYDVGTHKDAIVVRTPQEALQNNAQTRRKKAIRGLKKALRKLDGIPQAELIDEECEELKTAQHRIGLIVDFAQRHRRAMPEVEKTHERQTPAVL